MKVLRNVLNDNNSEIKERAEKKVEIFAHKNESVSPDMNLKVMNRLLSVILWLIIRETTLLFPAGAPLKQNSNNTQSFTVRKQKNWAC